MANEVTVPLLPCGSIDDIAGFYRVLGFRSTYRQLRPNPYLAIQREDLHLHFFGMPDFLAENSYGSCRVLVPDVEELYGAFADGMRAEYGKVLVSGIPPGRPDPGQCPGTTGHDRRPGQVRGGPRLPGRGGDGTGRPGDRPRDAGHAPTLSS